MNIKLLFSAVVKFLAGVLMISLLLFIPAGTLYYPKAWLLLGVMFVPMLILGIILMVKSPELLAKRLNSKEKENTQKTVVALSLLMFIAGFVVSALDFRFSWFPVPDFVSYIAAVIFILGYAIYGEVMRENAYLSRTVEVQENQKVIDTGLYGIVRHPMYTSTLLIFLSVPLILGSLIGVVVFFAYPFIIGGRIINEEKILTDGLNGYAEYKKKVKWRMIPFIW
ncbi:MAG: isoprenylcysteine carboxylmethyltransferase family protein [Ruminococcus sp.]|nr:isoprenylcysteine carboxylmethyltransferase family protein [Ruminococcus sp.]